MMNNNVKRIVKTLNLEDCSILHQNLRKDTYVIKALKDEQVFILKVYNNEIDNEGAQTEINIFTEKLNNLLPYMKEKGDDYILIDFISGKTLRQGLLSHYNDMLSREKLLYKLEHSYSLCNDSITLKEIILSLKSTLVRLMSSRPHDIKKPHIIFVWQQKIMAKMIFFILKKKLHKVASFYVEHNKNYVLHGDLHLNNVLIDKNNNVYLIDWENSWCGPKLCDYLYFIPQYLQLTHSEKKLRLQNYLTNIYGLDQLLPVYSQAIKTNKAFQKKENKMIYIKELLLLFHAALFFRIH